MTFAVKPEPKSKSKAEVSAHPAEPAPSQFDLEAAYGAPAGIPLFLASSLQRKLSVGAVDDPLEREADQVAEQVMRMPEPAVQASPTTWDTPSRREDGYPTLSELHSTVQRKCSCGGSCDKCKADKEEVKIQRKPAASQRAATVASHDAPEHAEDPASWAELLIGIEDLVGAAYRSHGLEAIQPGIHLSKQQADLLFGILAAISLANDTSPGHARAGLELYESIKSEVDQELENAKPFVEPGALANVRNDLNWLYKYVLQAAAYGEAHQKALTESDLPAPDLGFVERQFEQEQEELKELKEKLDDLSKVTSIAIAAIVFHDAEEADTGQEIFELFMSPGTIQEKLKEGEKIGILTASQLVIKIAGLKNTIIKTTYEVLKSQAKKQASKAVTEALAEHWGELADGYGEIIENLKVVGKVVGFADVAVEAILAFKEAWNHNWDAMFHHAAKGGIAIAGVYAGGVGTVAALLVVGAVWVELRVIHMVAEIIRQCRDEMVREAAGKFIEKCKNAEHTARDVAADVEAFYDPSNDSIQYLIQERLEQHGKQMQYWFAIIYNEVAANDVHSLGYYPDLVMALGSDTMSALSPFALPNVLEVENPLSMGERIRDVFAGANAMGRYVADAYPSDEEASKDSEGWGAAVNIDFQGDEEPLVKNPSFPHEDAPIAGARPRTP